MLNGSAIEGEATKLGDILKADGYNVANIGNADSSDYEKTEIHHKEKVPESIILGLDKILNTLYASTISANLEEDSESDIVITIGSSAK